jgi:dTDP-4-dehydrorhamnose 3,5-epimerase
VKLTETPIAGVRVVEFEPVTDGRGFFARAWCSREFHDAGLEDRIVQVNVSVNREAGTVRGLHFQADPWAEGKVIRCTSGAIFDVAVDLRPGSATLGQWFGIELTADNHRGLYIPKGCAHGFQSLVDETEILYLMTEYYAPGAGRGIRYDDPQIGIRWPVPVTNVSDRDQQLPAWEDFENPAGEGDEGVS